jgi:hypothetical protein
MALVWIENPRVGGSIPPQATIHRSSVIRKGPLSPKALSNTTT